MAHDDPIHLYRTFHSTSVSQFQNNGFTASSKATTYTPTDLANHFNRQSTHPTPWISTSSHLLRVIKLALNHHLNGHTGIYVAVIESDPDCVTNAAVLARRLGVRMESYHETEWLWDREIPALAVAACLNLETLIARGLFQAVPVLDPAGVWYCAGRNSFQATSVKVLQEKIIAWAEAWEEIECEEGDVCKEIGLRAARVVECFGVHSHSKCMIRGVAGWWGSADCCGAASKTANEYMESWVDWDEIVAEEEAGLRAAMKRKSELVAQGEKAKAKNMWRLAVKKGRARRNRWAGCFEGSAGMVVDTRGWSVEDEKFAHRVGLVQDDFGHPTSRPIRQAGG